VRVGIFGGTFDPPHVGHLLVASDAYESLSLDRLLFVPTAQQPFKSHMGAPRTTVHQERAGALERMEMMRRAVASDSRFEVSAIEIDRGGLSFTVDTLTELAERSPGDTRYLLFGADVLGTFAQWRQPERILELATLAVFARSTDDGATDARASWERLCVEWRTRYGETLRHEPVFLEARRIDVSSTEVRARVTTGRSILGFVPDAVAAYVAERGLYGKREQ
jgi:nicotinate-nucleotide adenylyltransferase